VLAGAVGLRNWINKIIGDRYDKQMWFSLAIRYANRMILVETTFTLIWNSFD